MLINVIKSSLFQNKKTNKKKQKNNNNKKKQHAAEINYLYLFIYLLFG